MNNTIEPVQIPSRPASGSRKTLQAQGQEAEFLTLRLLHKSCRVQLFPTFGDISALPGRLALFAVSSPRGLFAAAGRTSDGSYNIRISPLAELRKAFDTQNAPDDHKLPFQCMISVPLGLHTPVVVRFAYGGARLVVGTHEGSVIIMNVNPLVSGQTSSGNPTSLQGLKVREIVPNPAEESPHVAILRGEGSSTVVEIVDTDRSTVAATWSANASNNSFITSLSWSAKGKQIALGLSSGDVVTYSPNDMKTVKTVFPRSGDDSALPASSLSWLSNSLVYVVYSEPDRGSDQPISRHFINNQEKSSSAADVALEVPCPPFGPAGRPSAPQTLILRNWSPFKYLLFVADGPSTEIGVVGDVVDSSNPSSESWVNVILEESSMATLPLNEDFDDTAFMGFDFDLTASEFIKGETKSGEDTVRPPGPTLYVYASDGTLVGWNVFNDKGGSYPQMVATSSPPSKIVQSTAFQNVTAAPRVHVPQAAPPMNRFDDPPSRSPSPVGDADMEDELFGGLSLGGTSTPTKANNPGTGMLASSSTVSSSVFGGSGGFMTSTIKPGSGFGAFGDATASKDSAFAALAQTKSSASAFGTGGFGVSKPPAVGGFANNTPSGSASSAFGSSGFKNAPVSSAFGSSGFGTRPENPVFGGTGAAGAPPSKPAAVSGGFGAFASSNASFGAPSSAATGHSAFGSSSSPDSKAPAQSSPFSAGFSAFGSNQTSAFAQKPVTTPATANQSAFGTQPFGSPSPFTSASHVSAGAPASTFAGFGQSASPSQPPNGSASVTPRPSAFGPGGSGLALPSRLPDQTTKEANAKATQERQPMQSSRMPIAPQPSAGANAVNLIKAATGFGASKASEPSASTFSGKTEPPLASAGSFVSAFGVGGSAAKPATLSPPQSSFGNATSRMTPTFGSSTSFSAKASISPASPAVQELAKPSFGGFASFSSGSSSFSTPSKPPAQTATQVPLVEPSKSIPDVKSSKAGDENTVTPKSSTESSFEKITTANSSFASLAVGDRSSSQKEDDGLGGLSTGDASEEELPIPDLPEEDDDSLPSVTDSTQEESPTQDQDDDDSPSEFDDDRDETPVADARSSRIAAAGNSKTQEREAEEERVASLKAPNKEEASPPKSISTNSVITPTAGIPNSPRTEPSSTSTVPRLFGSSSAKPSAFGSMMHNAIGLGRPSSRPTQSSPLANAPNSPESATVGDTPSKAKPNPAAVTGAPLSFKILPSQQPKEQRPHNPLLASTQPSPISFQGSKPPTGSQPVSFGGGPSRAVQTASSFSLPQAELPNPMQRAFATAFDGMNQEFSSVQEKLAEVAGMHYNSRQGESADGSISKELADIQNGLVELHSRIGHRQASVADLQDGLLKQEVYLQHIKRLSAAVKDTRFSAIAESRPLDPDQTETQLLLRRKVKESNTAIEQLGSLVSNLREGLEAQKRGRISLKTPSLASIDKTCIFLETAILAHGKRLAKLKEDMLAAGVADTSLGQEQSRAQNALIPPKAQMVASHHPSLSIARTVASALNAESGAQNLKVALLSSRREPLLTRRVLTPKEVFDSEDSCLPILTSLIPEPEPVRDPLVIGPLKPPSNPPSSITSNPAIQWDLKLPPLPAAGIPEASVSPGSTPLSSKRQGGVIRQANPLHAKSVHQPNLVKEAKSFKPPEGFSWGSLPGTAGASGSKSSLKVDLRPGPA